MTESLLAKKLKLKPAQRAAVFHAPDGYLTQLEPLPEGVEIADKLSGKFDWVQVFVMNKAELGKLLPRLPKVLKPASVLWISFPKGTSKIQTDLTRDTAFEVLKDVDLMFINLVSVNETWSAFSLRPYKPGEARQAFR
ncbi:MAG TPA: hypothetical protein VGK87_12030 [Anaerolineae bacterium]|jgi:hypothetical protein